ncbi:hypothetical protein CDAR_503291 [Caerostris darwini]|uniref:Uncharacterized protein n=1 Tax=Caerostris darwini TaxID=1538125 RepID=A0AAV4V1L8_9ARAC|nr:hypothetical protein CDAR_503291 [Caerostris darwini]
MAKQTNAISSLYSTIKVHIAGAADGKLQPRTSGSRRILLPKFPVAIFVHARTFSQNGMFKKLLEISLYQPQCSKDSLDKGKEKDKQSESTARRCVNNATMITA